MIRALAGLAGLAAGYAIERGFLRPGEPDDGLVVWGTVAASVGLGGLAYAVAALLTGDGDG